jgi:hypothetical protein
VEQWFRPMDLNLRVLTNSPELEAAVRDAYGRFGAGDRGAAPQLQFAFEEIEETDNAVDRPPVRTYRSSPLAAELEIGDTGALSIDRRTGAASGRFTRQIIRDRSSFRLHALHFALSAALVSGGFLGIHAACIAVDGAVALLRGRSGAGKTTLAYAGARRGFQVVAGSTVWIAPDESVWWGIPWWIYLRPSAEALFPEIADTPAVPIGGETRHEIDMARLGAGRAIPRVRPGIIVWVDRYPGGDTNLEPINAAEALRLWRQGAAGNEVNVPGYQARVRRLVGRRNFRLRAGDDLDRALDLIALAAHDGAPC